MLHSKVPCPSGVRASKRGSSTPQVAKTTKRVSKRKYSEPMCIFNREGNRAVPALRMYKNASSKDQSES